MKLGFLHRKEKLSKVFIALNVWIPSWLVAAPNYYLRGAGFNPVVVYFSCFFSASQVTAHLRVSLLYLILVYSYYIWRACFGCGIAICVQMTLPYSLLPGQVSLSLLSFKNSLTRFERDMLRINRLIFKTGSRVEIVCCSSLRRRLCWTVWSIRVA